MGMVGLIGYNMFNNTGNVGTKLWEMALNEGGGNPSMKHNPIYVKSEEEKSEVTEETEIETEAVVEEIIPE